MSKLATITLTPIKGSNKTRPLTIINPTAEAPYGISKP